MKREEKGFTLLEILVGLAVASIVLTAIYQTYLSQQKAYVVQEEVAAMQQNLRAAILMIGSELRMAGYDPSGKANAGIISISNSGDGAYTINFTKDLNGDGVTDDADEDITYLLDTANGVQVLGRRNPTDSIPVAENIDALNLVFLDADNNVIAVPSTNIGDIRSIQITLVARAARSEQNYVNNFVYENQQGTVVYSPGGDGLRRMLLTTQVKCRNLGL